MNLVKLGFSLQLNDVEVNVFALFSPIPLYYKPFKIFLVKTSLRKIIICK